MDTSSNRAARLEAKIKIAAELKSSPAAAEQLYRVAQSQFGDALLLEGIKCALASGDSNLSRVRTKQILEKDGVDAFIQELRENTPLARKMLPALKSWIRTDPNPVWNRLALRAACTIHAFSDALGFYAGLNEKSKNDMLPGITAKLIGFALVEKRYSAAAVMAERLPSHSPVLKGLQFITKAEIAVCKGDVPQAQLYAADAAASFRGSLAVGQKGKRPVSNHQADHFLTKSRRLAAAGIGLKEHNACVQLAVEEGIVNTGRFYILLSPAMTPSMLANAMVEAIRQDKPLERAPDSGPGR